MSAGSGPREPRVHTEPARLDTFARRAMIVLMLSGAAAACALAVVAVCTLVMAVLAAAPPVALVFVGAVAGLILHVCTR